MSPRQRKFPYKNLSMSNPQERERVEGRFIFIIVGWIMVDNARRQTVRGERVKKICVKCQHLPLTHLQHGAYTLLPVNEASKKKTHRKINIHNFCGLHCVTYNFLLICVYA